MLATLRNRQSPFIWFSFKSVHTRQWYYLTSGIISRYIFKAESLQLRELDIAELLLATSLSYNYKNLKELCKLPNLWISRYLYGYENISAWPVDLK